MMVRIEGNDDLLIKNNIKIKTDQEKFIEKKRKKTNGILFYQ